MHPFNLNQIINKVIKVFGVVDVEVDGALKNAVVTVEVDGAHVHILVVRNHLGDFAHDANLVDPRKGNEGQKGKNFMAFPDRKSTRLNSSHVRISYAVFCLKKKKNT